MARVVLTGKKRGEKLRRVAIEKADDGGHLVEHQFEDKDGFPTRSEHHVFGDGEDGKMITHLIEHLGLKPDEEDNAYDNESEADEEE